MSDQFLANSEISFEHWRDDEFADDNNEHYVGLCVDGYTVRKLLRNHLAQLRELNAVIHGIDTGGENKPYADRGGTSNAHSHDGSNGIQILSGTACCERGIIRYPDSQPAWYPQPVFFRVLDPSDTTNFYRFTPKADYELPGIRHTGNGTGWDVYVRWTAYEYDTGSATPAWHRGTLPIATILANSFALRVTNSVGTSTTTNLPASDFTPAYAINSTNGVCRRDKVASSLAFAATPDHLKLEVKYLGTGLTLVGNRMAFAIHGYDIQEAA